jgi:hypothetical protein
MSGNAFARFAGLPASQPLSFEAILPYGSQDLHSVPFTQLRSFFESQERVRVE